MRVVERRRFPFEAFDDCSARLAGTALASCWLPFCAASFLGPRPRPPREPRERLRFFEPSVPSASFFAAEDLAAAIAPPSVPEDSSGKFCSLVKFHSLLKHSETHIEAPKGRTAFRYSNEHIARQHQRAPAQCNIHTKERGMRSKTTTTYRTMRAAE